MEEKKLSEYDDEHDWKVNQGSLNLHFTDLQATYN